MPTLRSQIALLLLIGLPFNATAEKAALINQLKFTITEYLIYTDQLQKLEQSACGHSTASSSRVETTQEALLAPLTPADRQEVKAMIDSPMLAALLKENTQGITSLLGVQDITQPPGSQSEQQRKTCTEYRLIFQQNLDATRADLNQLWQAYGNR